MSQLECRIGRFAIASRGENEGRKKQITDPLSCSIINKPPRGVSRCVIGYVSFYRPQTADYKAVYNIHGDLKIGYMFYYPSLIVQLQPNRTQTE